MTNFDPIFFRYQIDIIMLNLKSFQIFVDYLKDIGKKCKFNESEEREYNSIFNILRKDYFNFKLERFFTNCEKAGFICDFNQQVELPITEELAGLFVTDDDLNNFSYEGIYILNRLVVKLCFLDRFINNLLKYLNLEDSIEKRKELNIDLVQENLIELKKSIKYLIKELVRTNFVSQELRDMTTLVFWTEGL
nr:hypothetical protein [Navicula tsukamotoi]UXN44529.1 hypothetical protein [Navicula tsukamotoi]